MPGKYGTFGTEKWPVATMTQSNVVVMQRVVGQALDGHVEFV